MTIIIVQAITKAYGDYGKGDDYGIGDNYGICDDYGTFDDNGFGDDNGIGDNDGIRDNYGIGDIYSKSASPGRLFQHGGPPCSYRPLPGVLHIIFALWRL